MTTEIGDALKQRGFAVTSMQVRTPDGRTWAIDAQTIGGFRLFEIDPQGQREPEEHDAVNGDAWVSPTTGASRKSTTRWMATLGRQAT